MLIINCKNCNTAFEGNFCPNCSQTAKTHAINAATFLHDIPHDIFHIDKGFSYTFINLLKKPSVTLAEYIEGKRIRHFKPFAYVIIMSAISTFIGHWIEEIMVVISTKRGLQNVEIYHPQSFFK